MPAAVRVGEGVQRVVGVDAEARGGDEDRPGGAEGDVAAALADDAGADRRGGVVARSGDDLAAARQAERAGDEALNDKLNPPAMLGRLEEDVSGVRK